MPKFIVITVPNPRGSTSYIWKRPQAVSRFLISLHLPTQRLREKYFIFLKMHHDTHIRIYTHVIITTFLSSRLLLHFWTRVYASTRQFTTFVLSLLDIHIHLLCTCIFSDYANPSRFLRLNSSRHLALSFLGVAIRGASHRKMLAETWKVMTIRCVLWLSRPLLSCYIILNFSCREAHLNDISSSDHSSNARQ